MNCELLLLAALAAPEDQSASEFFEQEVLLFQLGYSGFSRVSSEQDESEEEETITLRLPEDFESWAYSGEFEAVLLERFLLAGSFEDDDFYSDLSINLDFATRRAERFLKHDLERRMIARYDLERFRERLEDWVERKSGAAKALLGVVDLVRWNDGWRPTARHNFTRHLGVRFTKDPFSPFTKVSLVFPLHRWYFEGPIWRRDEDGQPVWMVVGSRNSNHRLDPSRVEKKAEQLRQRGYERYPSLLLLGEPQPAELAAVKAE